MKKIASANIILSTLLLLANTMVIPVSGAYPRGKQVTFFIIDVISGGRANLIYVAAEEVTNLIFVAAHNEHGYRSWFPVLIQEKTKWHCWYLVRIQVKGITLYPAHYRHG